MWRKGTLALLLVTTAACRFEHQPDKQDETPQATATPSPDALAARDPVPGAAADPALADDRPRPVMQLQVVLDRLGFTPGVVDGENGMSTRNAVAGFQESFGQPAQAKEDQHRGDDFDEQLRQG